MNEPWRRTCRACRSYDLVHWVKEDGSRAVWTSCKECGHQWDTGIRVPENEERP